MQAGDDSQSGRHRMWLNDSDACAGPKAGAARWGHLTTRSRGGALTITTKKVLVTASTWSLVNHKSGW